MFKQFLKDIISIPKKIVSDFLPVFGAALLFTCIVFGIPTGIIFSINLLFLQQWDLTLYLLGNITNPGNKIMDLLTVSSAEFIVLLTLAGVIIFVVINIVDYLKSLKERSRLNKDKN
ncbi:MAG: hypothetical protein WC755_07690 [Candidatus Woesearchaeota archaeon]|jgi:hypothetical protein